MFQGLVQFQEIHGHQYVPINYIHKEKNLATWMDQQRRQKRSKSKRRGLSQEKVERLESICFDFDNAESYPAEDIDIIASASQRDRESSSGEEVEENESISNETKHWNFMFKGLNVYKETTGDLFVPEGCEYFGISLFDWVAEQRKLYKNKSKRNGLSKIRTQRLHDIGFDFSPKEKSPRSVFIPSFPDNESTEDAQWSHMLEGLIQFKDDTGHLDIPKNYMHDGQNLADWVREQRSRYLNFLKGEQPALSPHKSDRLHAVGLELIHDTHHPSSSFAATSNRKHCHPDEQRRWEQNFEGLVAYKKIHGNVNIPTTYVYQGRNVYAWLDRQRRCYTVNTSQLSSLLRRRMERLAELGVSFMSSVQEERWMIMFYGLEHFKKQYGHFKVPTNYMVGGRYLQKWVAKQRKYYQNLVDNKKLPMSPVRVELLRSIGFDFIPVRPYAARKRERAVDATESGDVSDEELFIADDDLQEPMPKQQKMSP